MTEKQMADLVLVRDRARKAGDAVGKRIAALWDPEARVYRNPEELSVLHTLANDMVIIYQRVKHLIEDIEQGPVD